MRAVFEQNSQYSVDEIVVVGDENFHHLKNVVRARVGEDVLILNGEGKRFLSTIFEINRREICLKVQKVEVLDDNRILDIAFCLTKKNSFELAIKVAVELGIHSFIPIISEFSQNYELNDKRVHSLIMSAMLQSNAAHLLNIKAPRELETFLQNDCNDYGAIHLFDLEKSGVEYSGVVDINLRELILIGPEGGFSQQERSLIFKGPRVTSHYLPMNILRASTALPTSVGYIIGKQL